MVTDDLPGNSGRVGIFYFYSDYLDPCGLQTPVNALGSLLQQFGTKWPAEMDEIMRTRGIDRHKTYLTTELAVELFRAALETLDEVFICLYGMEFWEKPAAQDFLQTLWESFYRFHGQWKLFSSSAIWGHQKDLQRFLGAKSDVIYFEAKHSDTAKYVKYWIEKDDSTSQVDGKFLEELSSCLHDISHREYVRLNYNREETLADHIQVASDRSSTPNTPLRTHSLQASKIFTISILLFRHN